MSLGAIFSIELHAVWFIRDGFIRDAFRRLLDLLEILRDEV